MLESDQRLTRLDVVSWREFPIGITGKTLKRVLRERTEPGEVEEANRPLILAVEPGNGKPVGSVEGTTCRGAFS
jgi:long-chain acyl-CoA synthetase